MNERDRLINVRNEIEHAFQLVLLLQRYSDEVELLDDVSDDLVNNIEDVVAGLGDSMRLAYENLELGMRDKPFAFQDRTEVHHADS